MAPKRTYYPTKTFDDDLAAFTEMCLSNKWEFPGVSVRDLQEAVKAQRAERAKHDALELKFFDVHEKFGLEQAARYQLYAAALHAARGLFRNNKAVLAQLERFKSPTGGRKKAP